MTFGAEHINALCRIVILITKNDQLGSPNWSFFLLYLAIGYL